MCVIIGMAIIATASNALIATVPAYGTQVVPTDVQYYNDDIEQGGRPQACVVTAAITNAPAPEIVNFQFLRFANGRVAFKVTAGDLNWANSSMVARRISEADFFTGAFNHPNAFDRKITPEGQLVAFLVDPSLTSDFVRVFFGGNYSIRFRRSDINDERFYEIQQAPGPEITAGFNSCLNSMAR